MGALRRGAVLQTDQTDSTKSRRVSHHCRTVQEGAGEQGARAPYNAAAKFYQVYSHASDREQFLGISHLGYDRKYSTAQDRNSYFPMVALQQAAAKGLIGAVAARYYGAPTNRSQVTTVQQDCADLLALMQQDEVDLAILVPS